MMWNDDRHGATLPVQGSIHGVEVHRHKDHGPDVWLVSFYEVGLKARPLASKDLEDAKGEAVALARARLTSMLTALDAATPAAGSSPKGGRR